MELAKLLACEWPTEQFQRLVGVVVDVCNAKLLHNSTSGALATCVERVDGPVGKSEYSMQAHPLYQDGSYKFWYSVGLLEFLYECSGLMEGNKVLDGYEARGHKIPIEGFVLEGINKCNSYIEWKRWESENRPVLSWDVLRATEFQCSSSFRLLVAHNNVLPITFRRQCLVADINDQILKIAADRAVRPLAIEVDRDKNAIIKDICKVFTQDASLDGDGDDSDGERCATHDSAQRFLRPLAVSFKGEAYRSGVATQGPGVTREFFQVALRAFLAELFEATDTRTYWFRGIQRPDAYFACGVLLAQVLLHAELVPNVFPWTLYDLLLRDLGSPKASKNLTLQHLAAVSPAEADSIGKVQAYEGDDIDEVFGDAGWERVPSLEGKQLEQASKATFVTAYVEWSLGAKIAESYGPLSAGFRAVLGGSEMVQKMVDAHQLERIVCGGDVAVDLAAIRRRALLQNWANEDEAYVDSFWSVLEEFPESAKLKFVAFVTGSDRVPLQGWEQLRLKIQKHGGGDERLPTAYTCFSLVLLPKYSSVEVLRKNLFAAVADSEGFGLQ